MKLNISCIFFHFLSHFVIQIHSTVIYQNLKFALKKTKQNLKHSSSQNWTGQMCSGCKQGLILSFGFFFFVFVCLYHSQLDLLSVLTISNGCQKLWRLYPQAFKPSYKSATEQTQAYVESITPDKEMQCDGGCSLSLQWGIQWTIPGSYELRLHEKRVY